MSTDLQTSIQSALQAIPATDFRDGHLALLKTLGYESSKTIPIAGAKPLAFLEIVEANASENTFDKDKALFEDWNKADLLFQLTDEELGDERSLFEETEVKPSLLQSYLFFAIELNGKSAVNGSYARGKLTAIARQINRVFPMPVMLLVKHPEQGRDVLSIAVINRRANKREQHKDVLGKVTIIRDISLSDPHRGHLDILESFALPKLKHPERLPINSFDTLHTAWEEIFNVELLNQRFYKELANWYFWALPQVDFPADLEPDEEKRRATGLIRLLTRLIFCWFIKEKGLIPETLFHRADLDGILKDFDPDSSDSSQYYQAILQNLFFATLNQRMGKDSKGELYRHFVPDEGFLKNRKNHDLNNYYRYEKLFNGSQEEALQHFADIPFLNGGLFECLDRRDEDASKTFYLDGFSRISNKRPRVPNHLFFAEKQRGIDLSEAYGRKDRGKEEVSGLIRILNRYKFTIVENTPIDQEIALDPELLGKVFENLLASYNEETKTTARKQTGSFYTPRPIVDYMVDESLKSYLAQALTEKTGMQREDAEAGLDILFAYTEREHAFSDREKRVLIRAIDDCKILDPACGSGAFPMGVLHKLVYILGKLDPGNKLWRQKQIEAAEAIPDSTAREAAITAIEEAFDKNEDDYGRKLYLIENCLYGVDLQPIAIQISKLRFFISLICDQKTNRDKAKNHGIRPLPNLETKFVAADTLIGLPEMEQSLLVDPRVDEIEREIESLYHRHFGIQRRDQKLALQRRINELRRELGDILAESLMAPTKARHVAAWDPFDPQASSDFFDPFWMFGIFAGKQTKKSSTSLTGSFSAIADDELTATKTESTGFDIIIGNPPYIQIQKFPKAQKDKWVEQGFETYAATADIYCLFYEKGAQLLKDGGSLVYITSNKWMRAGYGEKLRAYLSSKVDTESVLDFGMAQNFGAATTYTCITRFYKQKPDDRVLSCYASDDKAAMADPEGYFLKNAVEQPNLSKDPWVVLSKERQEIKTLVEAQGIPLKKWDLVINYGIKTGFNDAFYITAEQRDALIAEDPKSAEIIVPLLRGRNLQRYGTYWNGEYMINTHNGIRLKGIPRIDVERNYPSIWNYLKTYETQLTQRQDQGVHWSNLRNCAYLEEFFKPKIILQEIAITLPFFFDTDSMFMDTTCFMLNSSSERLEYLTAILNSSTFRCCFKDNFPEYSGNAYRMKKIFIEKIPIKKPTQVEANLFEKLVPIIQSAKAEGQASAYTFLESLIDACVMECYFREHMAVRDLLFQDDIAQALTGYTPDAPEAEQLHFIETLINNLNAPSSKIRNRLLRLTADSPDLLAVIKKEGQV
jgi:type I restriction-modification system DNA methylase subunit